MLNVRLLFLLLCSPMVMLAGPIHNPKVDAEANPIQGSYQLTMKKVEGKFLLDGQFNESFWQSVPTVSSFWRKFPNDEGKGTRQTEVKVAYDDRFVYLAITAYDSGKAFIRTLKRDGGHDGSDGVGIILDPLNQHTNGFFFVVNAFNAQSEDQLSSGNGPNFSWDNKWYSETRRYADHWQAEVAIPFKTLRYEPDNQVWGINFVRIDTKTNEYSTWTKVPVNMPSYDLGYTGALLWEAAPPKAGSNIVVAPYVTGSVNSVKENGKDKWDASANGGFDAKIGLSSSLNLDLTVNPDFSQIEVDRQVTNLSRFNIFFPERRTFFLENDDLFSRFGIQPVRPFYSRRIGLDNNGNTIPIIGGARLTGNLSPSTRIGVMSMQTGSKGDYSTENYTAITASQRVMKRSVLKGYFLNRQGFLSEEEKKNDPLSAYGRNAGLEFNYSNLKGSMQAWGAYHQSFKPDIKTDDAFVSAGFAYNVRKFNFSTDFTSVGTNYYADMGFIERIENYDAEKDSVVRLGFRQMFNEAQYRLFAKSGRINTHRFSFQNFVVWNPDGSLNEYSQELSYNMEFKNTSVFFGGLANYRVDLLFPISFTGGKPLPRDSYKFQRIYAGYDSDFRKKFGFGVLASTGEFYNGTFHRLRASVAFRQPPHIAVSLNAELNVLKFPDEYGSTNLLLVSPRVDINFTNSIFWTTFLQYNTQANNFNINSRFQWRFRPMSDMYLVYTDNYFTDPLLKNKNRAVVVKMTYWLNV